MGYQLVIFDWDGTLMDSQNKIVHALQLSVKKMRLTVKPVSELKTVIGLGLSEAIENLYPKLTVEQIHHFANYYRYFFLQDNNFDQVLFNGVIEMLENLFSKDVLLAIATGKSRRGLEIAMQESGIKNYFHASRCADETRSKPHPQMLEEILNEFGLDASDAVMVGDTEYDMQMAKSIKMDALAITYGVHERERLLSCSPAAILDSIEDLDQFLSSRVCSFVN